MQVCGLMWVVIVRLSLEPKSGVVALAVTNL
nr:MAG TPA: hypothetical protein [Caudoviricetes sp.]